MTTLPDDELLAFANTGELEYSDLLSAPQSDVEEAVGAARELLVEHGDVFRQHLLIALLLEEQAEVLEDPGASKAYGKVYLRGYKVALRHTVDDLRDGSFLPGGSRFDVRLG